MNISERRRGRKEDDRWKRRRELRNSSDFPAVAAAAVANKRVGRGFKDCYIAAAVAAAVFVSRFLCFFSSSFLFAASDSEVVLV